MEACGTGFRILLLDAQGHRSATRAIYTWIHAHPKKTLIEHGVCLPPGGCARNPRRAHTTHCRHATLTNAPTLSGPDDLATGRGDLIIGKDSQCVRVERHHLLPDHRGLPLGRSGPTRSVMLTCRIQGLPEGER